jgi:hypothetical protein
VADQKSEKKYVICNGDEGDPGAFMDRMLLESYPYRIIEGVVVAGYAVGADEGIMYIRAEYPLAVNRVQEALDLCYEQGYLGKISWAAASALISGSTRVQAPSSAARRPPCWPPSRESAVFPGCVPRTLPYPDYGTNRR